MATIALYAGKMNQMPSLIGEIRKSVNDYSSELFSLKSKALNIRKSVCDLDDVIGMIQTSTQIQEQKAEALEAFSQKTEEFTAEAARIDEDAAAVVVGICVATCGWLPVAVAAFVGGLVGARGQLISDVIFWAVTGEWESGWGTSDAASRKYYPGVSYGWNGVNIVRRKP